MSEHESYDEETVERYANVPGATPNDEWPDLGGYEDIAVSLARMARSEHALRLEAEARAEAWKALAKDAIEEFEDARGYANDYFTEKWAYNETSARFVATVAALETGGEG